MRFESRLPNPIIHRFGRLLSIYEVFDGSGVQPRGALRRFDNYGTTLLLRGEGRFRDELGQETNLVPGSLVLTLPRAPHWFGPAKGDVWDELYVVFDGPGFDFLKASGSLDKRRRVLNLGSFQGFRQEVLDLTARPPVDALMSWMGALAKVTEQPEPSIEPAWTVEARHALSKNLEGPCDLAELATRLGMDYESFRKRFRQSVGVSPGRFRIERRLEFSRELLSRTQLTLSAIAMRTGYGDAFTLSKAFHQEYGSWPSQWRKSFLH